MTGPTVAARRAGRAWIAGVVVILGATVAANFYMLRVAGADPSFAVEPDYYRQALNWDDELAQREHNAALGWTSTPQVATGGDGATALRLRLTDGSGTHVAGARVRVRAFPIARSADILEATLADGADGLYAAALPMHRAGMWELRVEAVRGSDRFTSVHRLDLPASGRLP